MKITGEPKYFGKNGNSGKEVRRYFCGTCASYVLSVRVSRLTDRPLYTEDDCLIVIDEDGISDESPVFVKIGELRDWSRTECRIIPRRKHTCSKLVHVCERYGKVGETCGRG